MASGNAPLTWVDISSLPSQRLLLSVDEIYVHKKTKYQDVWIVECRDYGKSLFLDGEWQSSVNNEFYYHESLVHPACVLHKTPRSVLVLGGGEGATIREILKWKTIEKVTMVDIDGELVAECRKHLPEMHQGAFDDPRVELIIEDAVEFLDKTQSSWDIIISDLTSPVESGPSDRLYSSEYLGKCMKILNPDGLFVIQSGSSLIFSLPGHAKLAKNIRGVFPYSISYANIDGWTFVAASKKEIEKRIVIEDFDLTISNTLSSDLKALDGFVFVQK
ncbi:MAG: methyltransferase domain-containing protein [Chloroflexi bacterium]|nr:methyltransferase domain-containing protein [Chloroflexota bacterium]